MHIKFEKHSSRQILSRDSWLRGHIAFTCSQKWPMCLQKTLRPAICKFPLGTDFVLSDVAVFAELMISPILQM